MTRSQRVASRGRRRRGLSLVEFLVCALVLAMMMGLALAGLSGAVGEDPAGSEHICAANKRALRAALATWQILEATEAPLALPEGYPELRRLGLVATTPHEPGTEAWPFTYQTTPEGRLVCRRHDLRQGRDGPWSLRRARWLLLHLVLLVVLALGFGLRHLCLSISPSDAGAVPEPEEGLEVPGVPVDTETAAEVAAFLRELMRGA